MVHLVALFALSIASIAFVPSFVNAAAHTDAAQHFKQPANKQRGLSLTEFIDKVLAEGEDNNFLGGTAVRLGLEPDNKSKDLEKLKDECADNRDRTADVVVGKPSESDHFKPVSLILLAKKTQPGVVEGDWFKIKPDGTIEKAFRNSGKLTEDGHGVPGSGVKVDFDPDEAQRLLKRELDFWLKGIGLKKKPAETAKKDAVKAATEPAMNSEVPSKTDAPAKPATK